MAIQKIVDDMRTTTVIDAAKVTTGTMDAARIGSGTLADARISQASVVQHSPPADLTAVQNDIAILALHQATNENKSAYGLANSWIEQFEDSTYITGLTDVARNAGEYISSVSGGGVDDYTRLMLHMDDTGLTDSATYGAAPHTITKAGSATRSGTQSKFGTYSYYADGSGDYLSIPAHSELSYNSGAFTIDFWWQPTSLTGRQTLIAGATDNRWIGVSFMGGAGGKLNMEVSGTWSSGSSASPNGIKTNYTTGTWYHIAIVRGASTSDPVILYVDGVLDISYTQGATALICSDAMQVFGDWGAGNTWYPTGYMDEFRLSIGIERWTSAGFTLPSVAYTPLTSNPTGSFTSTVIIPQDVTNKSKVGLVVLYKEESGTNHLANNKLIAKVRANTSDTNYNAITLVDKGTFSTGVKIAIGAPITVTAGQALGYKIEFAGQASGSLETRVLGVAMTY
jgi:hypothetical protein